MSASPNLQTAARHRGDDCQGGKKGCDQRNHRSGNHAETGPATVGELNTLLREFEATFAPATPEPKLFQQRRRFLQQFGEVHTLWEKRQISDAEDFNVLRTMRLTRKELCHSDILAWLLDHRLDGFGTHAQGKRGFQLFLKRLDLPTELAKANYRVAREVSGEESRLDILIEAKGQFIIGIENKVGAEEIVALEDGKYQTQREWADLKRRGKELHVPSCKIKAFFLTPDNQRPRSRDFRTISWLQVADVFEAFAVEARPPMVKLFAKHYAEVLRRDVVTESQIEEE